MADVIFSSEAAPVAKSAAESKIRLQSNSVIVVGAWNPAIIQPSWLSACKVVESGAVEAVSANPLTKGFFFQMENVNWMVDEQRLQIWANGNHDTGVYAARILNLLSHTPVQAIGSNFFFQSTRRDWPAGQLPKLGDWSLDSHPTELNFEQFVWSGTIKMGEDTVCQMTLTEATEGAVAFNINFHRDTDASRAAHFAGRWRDDLNAAREIIHKVFRLRLDE